LLIMTDDTGFGVSSTFGGVIPTPTLDRIAANGLRYTNFNSTALCSPTRAAIITGRNHHSMGFGVVAEQATGYAGYDSFMTPDKATIGRILKDHGYRTSWFGKDHNTPEFQASQAGPFDQWPTGMGFDYFYGFVGGDANQWQPNLFRNTTAIYPYYNNPGWNLVTAMADDAIEYMRRIAAIDPEQPFFIYYVPGAVHAPHHPTPEWIRKLSDMHLFDKGWNELRDTIFANQKRLGVIPQDAKMTPWPDDLLKRWDQLTPDEKKMFIRQVDAFAAYWAYTDHEIGRVIQQIEDMGKLDNTLVIYIAGDNGNSAEGSLIGTPNEVASLQGVQVPVEDQLKYFYQVWGSDETYPHMAVAWTWAFDTPFSWTKQIASHFGGVRQGMAISWPKVIRDRGGTRHQFHHVIDIVPTILEATGIKAPDMVDGIPQTFDPTNADAASRHTTQYFEMLGDHALYHDGWIASTKVMRPPWDVAGAVSQDPASFPYELYDLTKDWTQFENLAARYPDKVKELDNLFWIEANKYQVLPLDATFATRAVAPRPNLAAGRTEFTWSGEITGTPNGDAPSILNASYNFKAEVEMPEARVLGLGVPQSGDGMIVTQGGRFGGYGFYVLNRKPVFLYNFLDMQRVRWEGADALTPGKHTLEFEFKYDGLGAGTLAFNNVSGIGRGGTGVLKVDGKEVARLTMQHTMPLIMQWDENFDIGADSGTPVAEEYQVPFRFTGKLNKLTLKIDRPQLTPSDIEKLRQAQRNNKASE
jgi:arylsulfatase A-like enzyme